MQPEGDPWILLQEERYQALKQRKGPTTPLPERGRKNAEAVTGLELKTNRGRLGKCINQVVRNWEATSNYDLRTAEAMFKAGRYL